MHGSGTPAQSRGAPSFSSPSSSTPTAASNDARAAALKGATLAFQGQSHKSAPKNTDRPVLPSPNPSSAYSTNKTDNNEALRAATQAARDGSLSRSRSPVGQSGNSSRPNLGKQGTGGSVSQDQRGQSLDHGQVTQRLSQHLHPPVSGHTSQSSADSRPSASYIAATLAASRSGTPSPTPGQGGGFARAPISATQLHSRISRRPSLDAGSVTASIAVPEHMPDTEPIQPTGSLISLFEGKSEGVDVDPVKKSKASLRDDQMQITHAKASLPTPSKPRTPRAGEIVDEKQDTRQAPKPKPKPPPSVVIRAATFKDAESWDAVKDRSRPTPTSSYSADSGVHQQSRGSTESSAVETQAKKQAKPPVARKPQSVANIAPVIATEPSTPFSHTAQRPLTALVSPEPRRVIRTPRLDPPGLPPRTSTEPKPDFGSSRRLSRSSMSSDGTFVSASSTQSPRPGSPAKELGLPTMHRDEAPASTEQTSPIPRHASSSPVSRSALSLRPPTMADASNSNLALDSLTDAIVASNLASTRLAAIRSSPGPPPLPAPRRHNRPRSPQHLQPQRTADSLLSPNRTGGSNKSPSGRGQDAKQGRTGMLHTLRAPPSSLSDDEDARRRTHRTRKKAMHPLSGGKKHAHNEGARRRWRDEVSVRERRRYEAVWASNRGLFLAPGWGFTGGDDVGRPAEGSEEADLVANMVVRDIWSRSRLPEDELAEVWELVDRRRDGTLGRMEFVVGMWLVDQRLRGRKLPSRVGESVWASVRGVAVPEPRGRKR
ncbi:hypothetical protein QBC47DRAFT_390578 [Echria macrotheca]|uniref:EH domain-containing protein n=1 Tax=Echria macrotheca TaxID=438768 RepID=A0AAJ0B6F5_9PEZI|nr:hypothetical protein QBC47DRAFT_390578 [Echria macrotheca]